MPADIFAAFVSGCAAGRGFVWDAAMTDARTHFGLLTKADLLAFIGNNGLEQPQWLTTRPLKNNAAMIVHAYAFYSGPKYGYVAFYFAEKTDLWIVKSFKPNRNPDPRVTSIH